MLRRVAAAALAVGMLTAGAPPAAQASPAEPGAAPQPVGQKRTWKLGSFLLPPAPAGTAPLNRPAIQLEKPCDGCWITGFVPRLVYADGTSADMRTGVMLHHFGLYDPAKPDPAGQRCAWGAPAFGAGDERAPWLVTPPGFGLKSTPGVWKGFVEVMNHAPRPREVFLEADVYTVPASTPGMKPVTPVLLSVADVCAGMEYEAPAGPSETSVIWTSPVTGRIVWGLGHVHPGGVGVVVDNLSTGRRICASGAGYGRGEALAGMVTSMSTCSWDSLGTVRKGEKLRVSALYDAPRAVPGAMGLMSLAIHETSDLAAGSPAPAGMHRTPTTKVPAAAARSAGHHQHGGGDGGH